MKAMMGIFYVVMAVWLLIAAALRIVLLLAAGSSLDPLPFVSGALGLVALLLAAPALEEIRQRREMRADSRLPRRHFPEANTVFGADASEGLGRARQVQVGRGNVPR